jgi:putative ABC transport system ATP-binding protein
MAGYEPQLIEREWNRATDRDWADALRDIPLLADIDKRRLRRLAKSSHFAEFSPGDIVLLKGTPSDSFFVILSGEARALREPAARTLTTGDFFGEMGALDGTPRSATVVATTELHVMRVPRQVFLELLAESGNVSLSVLTELGARVRRLEQRS